MYKFFTGCICLLAFYVNAWGQVLTPLESYPVLPANNNSLRHARVAAAGDTLTLPFFDDFAAYTGQPSPQFWIESGGVYINDQFGVAPPSLNVATFEGVNAAGDAYSTLNTNGFTDTLTSKPLNLATLNPATAGLHLSFYVQAGGLGGSPNMHSESNPSFLQLEFKDRNNNWQVVWQKTGENMKTDFIPVIVPVTDPGYFHGGFQFRFRSAGVQRGTDDTWNIDYVYLDANRNLNQPNRSEVALSQRLNSFLKSYTAMPVNQFFLDPDKEVNDSVMTRLNNLNTEFAPITWRGYTQVLNPAAPADTFLRGNAALPPSTNNYLIIGKTNAAAVPNNGNPIRIKQSIFLSTLERDEQLRQNDTVSRITELADYFAYDDGTAETNFSLNNSGNRQLAYQFDLNTPDYVNGIRVYITKTNRAGNVMSFRIWRQENGNPAGTPLATQSFTIPAVEELNRFYDIKFTNSVAVADTFYVGFSISSSVSDFVNIGYDLNENAKNRIKYNNNATGWLTFSDEPGALLIRPLMGLITGLEDEEEAEPVVINEPLANINVYPNPSTGTVKISGSYQELSLSDITGKLILTKTKAEVGTQLNLSSLAKGIYVLRIKQKDIIITKKIVLTD